MRRSRRRSGGGRCAQWLAVVAIAVALVGCADDEIEVWLDSVERPPGGVLDTVVSLQTEESQILVAPAVDRLFVRDVDEPSWQTVEVSWPAGIDEPGLAPFEAARRGGGDAGFLPRHYFTVHDGALWAVALPAVGRHWKILRSPDLGQSWQSVAVPEKIEEGSHDEITYSQVVRSLRISEAGGGLYLNDGLHVWRKSDEQPDGDYEELRWESISLEGVPLRDDDENAPTDAEEEQPVRGELPIRVRHYLPADETHPYEIVTAYGRQLEVFRRDEGEERFQKVAALGALDTDLVRVPDGESLFIVDSELLYRSDDRGDSWTELEVDTDSLAPQDYTQMKLFADESLEAGFELWLMGDGGSLWNSVDGGQQWEEVLERDPDGRGLTGLVRDDRDVLWASTEGRGMLRTADRGERWRLANPGLRAGVIYHATLADDQKMYIGTNSGLFERSIAVRNDRWNRLDQRATSALYISPEDDRMISGTSGGGIVVAAADRGEGSSEALPLVDGEQIQFLALHNPGIFYGRSSVVTFVDRPGSNDIVAWSHRQGPMVSNDGGSSWRRMPLGEAFRNAVEGSVVTGFLSMRDQTFFAVTRSRRVDEPTQLWRSRDGGLTWQATYSLMETEDETPMQLMRLPEGESEESEGLLMAHGARLAVSIDAGETWTSISGPWESGKINGMTVDTETGQVVLVMNVGHTTQVAWVDQFLAGGRVVRQHRLNWPPTRGLVGDRPLGLSVRGDEMLIQEDGRLYSGGTLRRQGNGHGNVSLVITLGAVLILTTIAFGYLRTWEVG